MGGMPVMVRLLESCQRVVRVGPGATVRWSAEVFTCRIRVRNGPGRGEWSLSLTGEAWALLGKVDLLVP